MRDLEEIRQDCEAAQAGPWAYDGMHYEITAPMTTGGNGYWVIASECRSHPGGPYECDQFGHEYDPTYQFIANARQDIPDLLAEVARLTARLEVAHGGIERLEAEVERLRGFVPDDRQYICSYADKCDNTTCLDMYSHKRDQYCDSPCVRYPDHAVCVLVDEVNDDQAVIERSQHG